MTAMRRTYARTEWVWYRIRSIRLVAGEAAQKERSTMWSLGARFGALLSVVLTILFIGAGTAEAQTAELNIDRVGTVDAQTGIATVTGTYSCGDATGAGLIEVTLRQQVGRVATVSGSGFFDVDCASAPTGTWFAEIVPTTG